MLNKLKKLFTNLSQSASQFVDGMANGVIYENVVISNGGGINIKGILR